MASSLQSDAMSDAFLQKLKEDLTELGQDGLEMIDSAAILVAGSGSVGIF